MDIGRINILRDIHCIQHKFASICRFDERLTTRSLFPSANISAMNIRPAKASPTALSQQQSELTEFVCI